MSFALPDAGHPEPLAAPDPDLQAPAGAAAPAELTLRFIERLPRMDWVEGSARPAVDGWPAEGQTVTWRAHVKSWFPSAQHVGYRWMLDGAEVSRGALDIAGGGEGTADFPWPWTFERHQLAFEVDPDGAIAEEEEQNNRVTIDTDALSVGFWVESSVYSWFRAHQRELRTHSTSFEDWAQRQMALYNELFRRAIWPELPHGVRERVRLDEIIVVPDGALPLDPRANEIGGTFVANQARPDLRDRTVDLMWGFPTSSMSLYTNLTSALITNQFYWYSGYVQHELGHARGMIDVYGMDVYDQLPGHEVRVSDALPSLHREAIEFNGQKGVRLFQAEQGLMASDWNYLDRISAIAWDAMKGFRARHGNYNEPSDIGWFMTDFLPTDVRLKLLDAQGRPVAGADVQIFQASPAAPSVVPYGRIFDATPDLRARTGADGVVSLGHDPFAAAGGVIVKETYCNASVLIRAEGDGVSWFFLTAAQAIEAGHGEGVPVVRTLR